MGVLSARAVAAGIALLLLLLLPSAFLLLNPSAAASASPRLLLKPFSTKCAASPSAPAPPLRVFMYDLPPRFHVAMMDASASTSVSGFPAWPPASGGIRRQHSVEYWMMASLQLEVEAEGREAVRVRDADAADAFFVPFFSSLSFNVHGKNMTDPDTEADRQLQVDSCPNPPSALLVAVFLALLVCASMETSLGAKRVAVPDDLDDVVDDEEDDAWRNWGSPRRSSDKGAEDPPPDFSRMDPAAIQAELLRRHTGPSYGFVKFRLGVSRSRDEVGQVAMRWSKMLRTGSVEAKFMAVDLSTLMFTMERGEDILELKEFILSQPEAYEVKVGDQVFRRPGDPPLDQVVETLLKERGATRNQGSSKDEL